MSARPAVKTEIYSTIRLQRPHRAARLGGPDVVMSVVSSCGQHEENMCDSSLHLRWAQ